MVKVTATELRTTESANKLCVNACKNDRQKAAKIEGKIGKWTKEFCPNFALICPNRAVQHVTGQKVELS
jgi:hypothetical protein